ncbi:MAG: hypothetical protein ACRDTM_02445 [Micromonosporaceae bacterium]
MSIVLDLWGQRGWAGAEVAGESHYAEAIRAVLGKSFKPSGSEIVVNAQLLPEPSNRFDLNAVAVWCGPHQVGYLPKEDAARYVAVLSALVANGWTPQVQARVWSADWSYDDEEFDDGDSFRGSVRLDLAEPHMLVPGNMPPSGEHRTLPVGAAIQVTGEEKHLGALMPHLKAEGECWVYATLHELVEPTARASKTVVEVRINEQRVGQLTPKMSGELLPAVRHLAETGALTSARAIVKGNRIKAEVVLYVARAHELPETWLNNGTASDVAPSSPLVADPGRSHTDPGKVDQTAPVSHRPIPPPPTSVRFAVPPGWPTPPAGWVPPLGWRPDPGWPPAPDEWQWWVPAWD